MEFITRMMYFVIILFGIINAAIFFNLYQRTRKLKAELSPISSLKIEKIFGEVKQEDLKLHKIEREKERINFWYNLYNEITTSFPYLGILGTVAALYLSREIELEVIEANFTMALGTTLLGLCMAILFKLAKSLFSSKIQEINHDLETLYNLNLKKRVN